MRRLICLLSGNGFRFAFGVRSRQLRELHGQPVVLLSVLGRQPNEHWY